MSKSFDSFLDQEAEASPIPVIKEDRLTAVTAQGDMIECTRIVDSWLSSHGPMLNDKLQYCKPDPMRTFIIFSLLLNSRRKNSQEEFVDTPFLQAYNSPNYRIKIKHNVPESLRVLERPS